MKPKAQNILAPSVRALVYLASDTKSLCRCTLNLKRRVQDGRRVQATLSVQFSMRVAGAPAEQTFTLLYHPENLIPGKNKIDSPVIPLFISDLQWIGRNGQSPVTRTMSLALHECPVLRSRPSQNVALPEKEGTSFQSFSKLANAKVIHILFDYNWLHDRNIEWFKDFIANPARFERLQEHVASHRADVVPNRRSLTSHVEAAESDDVPPYTAVPTFVPGAADSKHLPIPHTIGSDLPAIGSCLGLHPSTSLDSQMLQICLSDAIKKTLPGCLQTALSELLTSSASSLSSSGTYSPRPDAIPLAMPFQEMVLKPMVKVSLQQLFTTYLPTLQELVTDDLHPMIREVQEQLQYIGEDYVSEMTVNRDDNLHDMEKSACDLLTDFRETLAAAVEELAEHCGDKLTKAFDRKFRASKALRDEDEQNGAEPRDLQNLERTLDLLRRKQRKHGRKAARLEEKRQWHQNMASGLKEMWKRHRNKASALREQRKRQQCKAKSLEWTIKQLERSIAP